MLQFILDAVVRAEVKPTNTRCGSINQEMNFGYDSVEEKPGIDTDENDQRNLMQTNAEDKEPVRNENPRSPDTDKSELSAFSLCISAYTTQS